MSRLFTHHDRLYLFQSSFFNGSGSASKTAPVEADEDEMDADNNSAKKTNTTAAASAAPLKKKSAAHGGGGFSVYLPHFHKMFGLLAILNMLLYLTPQYSRVADYFGAAKLAKLSCVHVVLALSSFEFRIGRARNGIYTIYREMQLHTVIFTMRSWTVLMCDFVLGIDNIVHRTLLVLFWHVLADVATKLYRPPSGETTIRRSVDGKAGYQEYGRSVHLGLWFFSFSQLVGTFMLLVDSTDMARNAMFIMTPVQISAFLATLVRKGYFNSQMSVTVYFLVLLPIFFYHQWTLLEVCCMAMAQLIRFNLRMNKYIMWLGLAGVVAWVKGDLHVVAANTVAPLINQAFTMATGSSQDAVLVTKEMLSWIAVPSTSVVPAWIYNSTFQPGTGIGTGVGNLIDHVKAQLV